MNFPGTETVSAQLPLQSAILNSYSEAVNFTGWKTILNMQGTL